jgi:hypothetical protein
MEEREIWGKIRKKFMSSFSDQFQHRTNCQFPKFHALEHDDLNIDLFGSFKNLDEMNMEKIHQTIKSTAEFTNKMNIEATILKKVSLIYIVLL